MAGCPKYVSNSPTTRAESCGFLYSNGNTTAADAVQQCCGPTSKITSYENDCFRYCDVHSNMTSVQSCIADADVEVACFVNREASHAGPQLSKPAMRVIGVFMMGVLLGTMG